MDRALMRRIIRKIEEEPERLNMRTMLSKIRELDDDEPRLFGDEFKDIGPTLDQIPDVAADCKTAGCIAGWAVMLAVLDGRADEIVTYYGGYPNFPDSATNLLDLTPDVAESFFFGCAGVDKPDQMVTILEEVLVLDERRALTGTAVEILRNRVLGYE